MSSREYNTLYQAVGSRHYRYVRQYITNTKRKGKTLDIDDGNTYGWTPLMRAVYHGKGKITRLLTDQSPPPNPNAQNNNGDTALIMAAKRGDESLISLMIYKLRANVDMTDKNNTSAVLWAAKNGKWNSVRTLVNNSARVELPNNDDEIALHFAIRTKDLGNVNRLLRSDRSGNSLKTIDMQGRWPLHIAAETGDINIILLLIRFGARNSVYDFWSDTPAATALSRGFIQAGNILAQYP